MTGAGLRSGIGGLTLAALLTFCVGAKVATLLPITDEGRAAWARAFSGAALAAQVDEVTGQPPPAPAPEADLALIAEERALLARQTAALQDLEAEVALARAALEAEAGRLEALKTELEARLAEAEGRHEADIARLVDLYGTMKPKEAAALLTQMDLEIVVHVMTQMEPRRGAPILAVLPPGIAQAVSQVVLERGKLPGDQKPVRVQLR